MQNIKIMVVDDELEIAELIKDYLEAEQYDVIISTDGKECLKLFREYQPQLIVLDIMLPGLDAEPYGLNHLYLLSCLAQRKQRLIKF